MVLRRIAAALLTTAALALTGCGVYADSTGQACVIIIGIPICQPVS